MSPHPLLVGLVGMILVLFLTFPASARRLGGDDMTHLLVYPKANEALSLVQIAKLNHWQEYGPSERHWRPLSKLMWTFLAARDRDHTRHLWFATGLLAGVCAGLLGAVLRARSLPAWAPWAGLLVLAHPMSADLTLPFVGQSDLLAAAGLLLALVGFVRGGNWRIAGALGIAISILAKESGLPAVAAIPMAVFLAPGTRRRRVQNAVWAAAVTGGVIALRFAVHQSLTPAETFSTGEGTYLMREGERYPGVLETLGRYAWGVLSLQVSGYDNCHLKAPGSSAGAFPLAGGLVLAGLLAWLVRLLKPVRATRTSARRLRANRLAAAGTLWAGCFIAIYLHVIPIGAVWQGRFAFLSMMGLVMAACAAGSNMPREASSWLAWGLLAAGVLGGFKSHRRAADFKSPLDLWRAEAAMLPRSAYAKRCLALELNRAGKPLEALQPAREATEGRPWDGDAWRTLALVETALGLRADAVASFERAIPITPYLPAVHLKTAEHLIALGRFDEAERHLDQVANKSPENPSLPALREALEKARAAGHADQGAP